MDEVGRRASAPSDSSERDRDLAELDAAASTETGASLTQRGRLTERRRGAGAGARPGNTRVSEETRCIVAGRARGAAVDVWMRQDADFKVGQIVGIYTSRSGPLRSCERFLLLASAVI